MSYPAASQSYREMEILAMSPARRVVVLFTHLLVTLRRARLHIEQQDVESRSDRLLQAQEILHELHVSLDQDAGGALAEQLAAIYTWSIHEITRINMRPDVAQLDKLIRVVAELHEGFEGASRH